MKQKPPAKFRQIAVDIPTYNQLKHLASQEGFTMYGLVRESLKLFEEWRSETENWVDYLDRKK